MPTSTSTPPPESPVELSPTTARWLVTDSGRELVGRITAALDDGRDALAVSGDAAVRRAAGDTERMAAALAAAVARRRARARYPDAEQWLFTRTALEQASDPAVSAWRARRYLDAVVVDLCSGVGGDAAALLKVVRQLATVERDEARAVLAQHNLAVAADASGAGAGSDPVIPEARIGVGDALDVAGVRRLGPGTPGGGASGRSIPGGGASELGTLDEAPGSGDDFRTDGVLVHVDPGRRVGDRRVQDPSMTEPAVDALLARHHRAAGIGVVLAPGVDADHPALRARRDVGAATRGAEVAVRRVGAGPGAGVGVGAGTDEGADDLGAGAGTDADDPGVEVEYVQLGATLVEAVAWTGALRDGAARASATLLPRPDGPGAGAGPVHRLVRVGERGPRRPVAPVGAVLFEVAPAAIRARLHDDVGARLGLDRVAEHRAAFTGDELHQDPWVRSRPILAVTRARAGAVRQWLRKRDVGPVEIATHGVRVDPGAFWREIGRPTRGPNGIRIELVRRDTDSIAIITDDAGGHHGW